MNKKDKISIKIKVTAKQIWTGIGLIALGIFIAVFIGYFFFIGGMV